MRTMVVLVSLALLAMAQPSIAFGQVMLGPFTRTQDINGVSVAVPLSFELTPETLGATSKIRVRITGDLSDLRSKFAAIVDTIPLPSDNCGSYSGNNAVASIDRKDLLFRDGSLVLSLSGNVDMWDCREIPFSSPIKNKYASQPFDAELPLSVAKTGDQSIGLQLSRPDIELKGPYAFITNGVLLVAGVNVNDKAEDALVKAIDVDHLRLSVPTFDGFAPTVESARFVENGGQVGIEVRMTATVTTAALLVILGKLGDLIKLNG